MGPRDHFYKKAARGKIFIKNTPGRIFWGNFMKSKNRAKILKKSCPGTPFW